MQARLCTRLIATVPYLYEQGSKNIPLSQNISLCSYVLINYPLVGYADTMELCPYVRGYLTPLNPCSTRIFTSPWITWAHGNLFSHCVFRTENIGGVAASRGGWRIAPYVGISINPSVTCVTIVYRPSCSRSA